MTVVLSNLVQIRARFSRSVNLERDFFGCASLDGYILTTTARRTLRRISEGLTKPGGARAWTLTGPFGSGKSAFALFLASLLSMGESAKNLLKEEEPELHKSLFDSRRTSALPKGQFLPILATGARESVGAALLRGLAKGLEFLGTPVALRRLVELKDGTDVAGIANDRALVDLIENILGELVAAGEATGAVLVLDELGKHLEFAALNSDSGDLYVLQDLAEMAQRNQQAPVLMVTLLHQSFERYAERLTSLERSEWSKVQGRFEDVAFQESLEQIVRLLAGAIEFVGTEDTEHLWRQQAENLGVTALNLNLRPPGIPVDAFSHQLAGVYPLHPSVAFLLGPLFRKLAQNERSLFAFLSAHEPHGFQDYLLTTTFEGRSTEPYRLDRLYDYVVQAFGGALFSMSAGRRWAEIESTLERLRDANPIERRLVKVVGMLSVVGQLGDLKATQELIGFALGLESETVSEMLRSLCDRAILVYRGFQSAYGLWEGSDFDLEAKLKESRHRVGPDETIPSLLTRERPIRPLVARRHSIQTGTLRYFSIRYADVDELPGVIGQGLGDADGVVVVVFPRNARERQDVDEIAETLKDRPEVLLVVPGNTPTLHGYLHDLSCLRWLLRNSAELAGDSVARREIYARISELQRTVRGSIDSLLDDAASNGKWFHRGCRLTVSSRRMLTSLLSEICDNVYPATPKIANELVNRRYISSSAAAARNALLDAMLKAPGAPRLGIEGHPAERSIYEALFRAPGIHKKGERGEGWHFGRPSSNADPGLMAVWKAMESFLADADGERKNVGELFSLLQKPPYGMKEGCLPLILCAFLLANEADAALYEEESFVPLLTLPHFERLVKTPQKFELQRFRVEGVRSDVFARFTELFRPQSSNKNSRSPDVLDVVRPLCNFAAQLPGYSRSTQQLSETATRVRQALFKAEEPARLLFEDLPRACGVAPFGTDAGGDVEEFFSRLRGALRELQTSYDRLINDLENRFCQTFSLRGRGEEAREEFRRQAAPLLQLAVDDLLKSFLIRATDDRLEIKGWVESIATVLTSKPPKAWNDKDRAVFEVSLRELARKHKQLEALSVEVQQGLVGLEGDDVYCIGITRTDASHLQHVVRVRRAEAQALAKAEAELERWLLSQDAVKGSDELRIALLTKLSTRLISKLGKARSEVFEEQLLFDEGTLLRDS